MINLQSIIESIYDNNEEYEAKWSDFESGDLIIYWATGYNKDNYNDNLYSYADAIDILNEAIESDGKSLEKYDFILN